MKSPWKNRKIQIAFLAAMALANTSWLSQSSWFRTELVNSDYASLATAPAATLPAAPAKANAATATTLSPNEQAADDQAGATAGADPSLAVDPTAAQGDCVDCPKTAQTSKTSSGAADPQKLRIKPETRRQAREEKKLAKKEVQDADDDGDGLKLHGPDKQECIENMGACVSKIIAFVKGECKPYLKSTRERGSRSDDFSERSSRFAKRSRRSSHRDDDVADDDQSEKVDLQTACRHEMDESMKSFLAAIPDAIKLEARDDIGDELADFAKKAKAAYDEYDETKGHRVTADYTQLVSTLRELQADGKDDMEDTKDLAAETKTYRAITKLQDFLSSKLGEDNKYAKAVTQKATAAMDKGLLMAVRDEQKLVLKDLRADGGVTNPHLIALTQKYEMGLAANLVGGLNEDASDDELNPNNVSVQNVAQQILNNQSTNVAFTATIQKDLRTTDGKTDEMDQARIDAARGGNGSNPFTRTQSKNAPTTAVPPANANLAVVAKANNNSTRLPWQTQAGASRPGNPTLVNANGGNPINPGLPNMNLTANAATVGSTSVLLDNPFLQGSGLTTSVNGNQNSRYDPTDPVGIVNQSSL